MSKVEEGDLDIRVSMALVLTGRYRDLMEIRALVREKIGKSVGARFIHGTIKRALVCLEARGVEASERFGAEWR